MLPFFTREKLVFGTQLWPWVHQRLHLFPCSFGSFLGVNEHVGKMEMAFLISVGATELIK